MDCSPTYYCQHHNTIISGNIARKCASYGSKIAEAFFDFFRIAGYISLYVVLVKFLLWWHLESGNRLEVKRKQLKDCQNHQGVLHMVILV